MRTFVRWRSNAPAAISAQKFTVEVPSFARQAPVFEQRSAAVEECRDVRYRPVPGYRAAEAHLIQPFGGFDIVDLRFGGKTLRARTTSGYVGKAGARVWARIEPSQAHFFDTKSGVSLDIRLGD